MDRLCDAQLIQQISHGSSAAFTELIRRYEHQLVTMIRYYIGDPNHAEDVLQETLLQVWKGIARLRKPEAVGGWLRRVAQNRCYDFLRSAQRHDVPIDEHELELHVNRFGRAHARQDDAMVSAMALLADVPDQERDTAQLFYLAGLSIREIAERHACPEGTVKRRLFHARVHLRQALGATEERKALRMSRPKPGTKKQPFPGR